MGGACIGFGGLHWAVQGSGGRQIVALIDEGVQPWPVLRVKVCPTGRPGWWAGTNKRQAGRIGWWYPRVSCRVHWVGPVGAGSLDGG